MDISPLFDLRRRLHDAVMAGAASCPGDAGLARACEALAPLEAAAPVFRTLGDLVRRLCAPEGDERVAVLLEALTLADALACTQAAVAVPGETGPVEPAGAWGGTRADIFLSLWIQASYKMAEKPLPGEVEPAGAWGGAVVDIPYSVLRVMRERLQYRALWTAFELLEKVADTRREWFRDARLRRLLLRTLDSIERWGEHHRMARWLAEQGRDILPLLQASFDPDGMQGMASRVDIIHALAGDEANDFYASHMRMTIMQIDVRIALLRALPPTEENAGLLEHYCRMTSEESWPRKIACNLLARTPLPGRWDILRSLKEHDPEMVLGAMECLDSPEANALTVELWEQLLPLHEADPEERHLDKGALIGKSGPAIHDIYRRLAASESGNEHLSCETAETLCASILVTRDEGLLELAGELARDVSPCFAVPWLTGLLVMRSTSAAYDAACELLGPEGFGHGALSASAQTILADVFFRAHSPHDDARDTLTRPFDTRDALAPYVRKGGADADCLAAAVSSPCHMIERCWKILKFGWEKRVRLPFADALDPRWLDAMLLADPFEAYPYHPCRAQHPFWAVSPSELDILLDPFVTYYYQDEQRTLADLLFRLADLQDPHTRERLGAFFHEQALRGVERGYRVLLWLHCCGRSDYRGIMTAELCRQGTRHGEVFSFENYYKAFRLIGDPLTFAEEGEECLRLLQDEEVPPPTKSSARKLEKCIAKARQEASRIAGETA